jgi:signal transduction histidine kinase
MDDDPPQDDRLRPARDLHDWFAYEVTVIVLEAQAGQVDRVTGGAGRHSPGSRRPRQAPESVDRAVALMPDTQGLDDVAEVVRRFTAGTRMDVDFRLDGPGPVSPKNAEVTRRLVTEALTNIRRHAAGAGYAVIRINRGDRDVTVSVSNDGDGHRDPYWPPSKPASPRLAARCGPRRAQPRGWSVRADLPAWT